MHSTDKKRVFPVQSGIWLAVVKFLMSLSYMLQLLKTGILGLSLKRCNFQYFSHLFLCMSRKQLFDISAFWLQKPDHLSGFSPIADSESSVSGSPSCSQSSHQKHLSIDMKDGRRRSISRKGDDPSVLVDSLPERTQAGELFSATVKGRRPPPVSLLLLVELPQS